MASQEYINISEQIKRIVGTDRNISKIYKYKITGKLNKEFSKYIYQDFKTILKDFIEVLDDENMKEKPFYRKVYLYNENDFIKCFINYGYELGTWLNKNKAITPENNKSYFNFPLFFRESCRRCGITNKYTKMDDKELDMFLSECIDLTHGKSLHVRKDRKTIEDEVLVAIHSNENPKSQYERTWDDRTKTRTIMVDRDCGQGYGFDILTVSEYKERLENIVKSDVDGNFKLTRVEYKTMRESCKHERSEYIVETLRLKNGLWFPDKYYRYNPYRNILVDIKDENNICDIEPQIGFNKTGTMKIEFMCKPKKLNKTLTLKNSNN